MFDYRMSRRLIIVSTLLYSLPIPAQDVSDFIIVNQFGYFPEARKIAVLKDPQTGFDAAGSYTPGSSFSLVRSATGEKVYQGGITAWKNGATDASSGDRVWDFDFSNYTATGSYYVLDEENMLRSYEFRIAPDLYNEVLRQGMRTFFYQRSGFAKDVPYADPAWTDEASHVGPGQDLNCRSFFDKDNPDTEKDLSGGWYDAGDYNKYTSWTASYVTEMMKAYLERPEAWGDDYNIPESGNGIPDILDEALWGLQHLLRMQQYNGAALSIVGEAHGSPPSTAAEPSYYGPPNTSGSLNTASAFAISSKVYRTLGMTEFADTLLNRALRGWDWATQYPDSLFNNNDAAYNSGGLGAGGQETDDYGRDMARLAASCYLFEATGDTDFRDYFDAHFGECHMMQWSWIYPFEAGTQDLLLYYTTLPEGTSSIQDNIRNVYRTSALTSADNLPSYKTEFDPYMAHIQAYTWGSCGVKASQGSMYYNLLYFNLDDDPDILHAARAILDNLHGVNPLNFVYLSNMYAFGAERGVNEFYHSWFTNGSPLWDRVGVSTYGPAPGYLVGGPNPSYDWDGCCPSGCGSASNNAICNSESLSPPKDQPDQKSYKDFNTSWPLNSWSVTENSCGYQVRYIRLLSKFVTAGMDCNGDVGGTAFLDSCGNCAGGNTGLEPVLDTNFCPAPIDCNDDRRGTAFIDSCGDCAGGNTGLEPVTDPVLCYTGSGDIERGTGPGIYPNPSNDHLTVRGFVNERSGLLIRDLSGKILHKSEFTEQVILDISDYSPGLYEVSIFSENAVRHFSMIKL